MPLHTSQIPSGIAQAPSPVFLIFWASGTPAWCPDCRDAEPAVHSVFGTGPDGDGPVGHMIYVGDKPAWRDPQNQYRNEYSISSIPTILRWENGKETARLEEYDCQDEGKLHAHASNVIGSREDLLPNPVVAFNHALTCLAKFGDNLSLQATRFDDGQGLLRLSTINSSSSAFAAFFFYATFFEHLTVRLPADYEPVQPGTRSKVECQLHAKAIGSILKSRHNKGLEKCELHITQPLPSNRTDPSQHATEQNPALEPRLLLRLHCAHGVVKTHKLTYEPKKSLYPTANPYPGALFVLGPRTASEWLDHFLSARGTGPGSGPGKQNLPGASPGPAGEVSLHCGPDFCIVKNKEIDLGARLDGRLGDNRASALRSIQTQVRIDMQDFQAYDVPEVIYLTFPLKEFKAAIMLAESLNLSLEVRFGPHDQPLFILITNAPQIPTSSGSTGMGGVTFELGEPTVRAEFVLATTHEPNPADPLPEPGVHVPPVSKTAPAPAPSPAAAEAEGAQPSPAIEEPVPSRAPSQAPSQRTQQSRAPTQRSMGSLPMQLDPVQAPKNLISQERPLFQPSDMDHADVNPSQPMVEPVAPVEPRPPPPPVVPKSMAQELRFSNHGRFYISPSQASNFAADGALLAQIRAEERPSQIMDLQGSLAENAERSGVQAASQSRPVAEVANLGTPWGATAALADGSSQRSVQPAYVLSQQDRQDIQDLFQEDDQAFFGDDLLMEDGAEKPASPRRQPDDGAQEMERQRSNHELADEPGDDYDEDEDEDDDEDIPPTPTPPNANGHRDVPQEDEVERLRRRKKYRPVF
ncbi:hypothetical protein OC861_004251 [Tilletia horrida]|nr:hypothetical protein OC861_004251 [Tilletia horrida]